MSIDNDFDIMFDEPLFSKKVRLENGATINALVDQSVDNEQILNAGVVSRTSRINIKYNDFISNNISKDDIVNIDGNDYRVREKHVQDTLRYVALVLEDIEG